jgi:hypothetical protein
MEHEVILEHREVNYLRMLLDNDLFLDKQQGVYDTVPMKQELFKKVETLVKMAKDAPLRISPIIIVESEQ